MDAENLGLAIATALCCLECRREWSDSAERWRMYAIFDEEPEHGLYCPTCASNEFDE